ncbi:uncharacterized protein LOC124162229 [Ischnura elegans]|uniref:uncharacterized protein LOC124162229 n=1 Tax=Ischnura elegans TaxID=197161 RepID=UPI001ED873D4|nr:uncharacterized protein LOC124162229 [Ischnura elegans]
MRNAAMETYVKLTWERTWVVVEFTNVNNEGDADVAAVPSSWLVNDEGRQLCYFPEEESSRFKKFSIMNCISPNVSWPRHECRILPGTTADTYGEVCQFENAAIETSDSDIHKPRGRGLRKKRPSKRVRDQMPEEMSDSETEERANGRGISPPPIYVNITDSHEPATQPESNDVQDSYPIVVLPGISNKNDDIEMVIDHREDFTMVQQPSRNGAERCTCSHGNVDDKLNAILSKLVKMEQQMSEQASMLATLTKGGGNPATQANHSMEKTFPLKTLKGFEELECSLESDPELFEQVVQTLQIQGGNSVGKAVYNMLYFCMTDDVGSTFTFKGLKKEKKGFCSTQLCSAVFKALRCRAMFASVDRCVFQDFAGEWLRQASCRLRKVKGNKEQGKA